MTVGPQLVECHFIVSNTAHVASRTILGAKHPIRRVMKIFLYKTGNINVMGRMFLTPEDGLLHRMSGLKYESLVDAFTHFAKTWKYSPLPEDLEARGFDESVKARLPLYTDALPIWNAYHRSCSSTYAY